MEKGRKSNFELLRIISILLIISYHFCSETSANIFKSSFSFNQLYSFCIGSWGLVGVHSFFFISAYFQIKNNSVRSEKLFKIVFETLFYSGIAVIIVLLCDIYPMGKSGILYNCIAPLMGWYWFIPVYLMLYVMSPFLNIFLNNIATSPLKKCVIVLTLIVPVFFTIWGESPCGTLGMAIYDYFLVALVEKKSINISKRTAIICLAFSILFVITVETAGSIILGKPIAIVRLTGRCSGFQIVVAFFLFLLFKSLQITKGNRIVNVLSKNTLGVYLIHESPLLGGYIRDDLLKINKLYFSHLFPVYLLIAILSTFIVATAIDKVRTVTVEKVAFSLLKKKNSFQRIDMWINDM